MADRSAKRSPANQRVQYGLKRTKHLKAVCHWVRRSVRGGIPCDVRKLTLAFIADLIHNLVSKAAKKDSDSTLYYPEETFVATDCKKWIKKVENYLDSRAGKSGVPLCYVIQPADINPVEAPDEYTRVVWVASFHIQQYRDDNRKVYHLFKAFVDKTEGATWFEKVKDGDGCALTCYSESITLVRLMTCVVRPQQTPNWKLSTGKVRHRSHLKNTSHDSMKNSKNSRLLVRRYGKLKR
jgi:hypothetical protein